MSHIFISYSHKDRKYVENLEKTSKNESFIFWLENLATGGLK